MISSHQVDIYGKQICKAESWRLARRILSGHESNMYEDVQKLCTSLHIEFRVNAIANVEDFLFASLKLTLLFLLSMNEEFLACEYRTVWEFSAAIELPPMFKVPPYNELREYLLASSKATMCAGLPSHWSVIILLVRAFFHVYPGVNLLPFALHAITFAVSIAITKKNLLQIWL